MGGSSQEKKNVNHQCLMLLKINFFKGYLSTNYYIFLLKQSFKISLQIAISKVQKTLKLKFTDKSDICGVAGQFKPADNDQNAVANKYAPSVP